MPPRRRLGSLAGYNLLGDKKISPMKAETPQSSIMPTIQPTETMEETRERERQERLAKIVAENERERKFIKQKMEDEQARRDVAEMELQDRIDERARAYAERQQRLARNRDFFISREAYQANQPPPQATQSPRPSIVNGLMSDL